MALPHLLTGVSIEHAHVSHERCARIARRADQVGGGDALRDDQREVAVGDRDGRAGPRTPGAAARRRRAPRGRSPRPPTGPVTPKARSTRGCTSAAQPTVVSPAFMRAWRTGWKYGAAFGAGSTPDARRAGERRREPGGREDVGRARRVAPAVGADAAEPDGREPGALVGLAVLARGVGAHRSRTARRRRAGTTGCAPRPAGGPGSIERRITAISALIGWAMRTTCRRGSSGASRRASASDSGTCR